LHCFAHSHRGITVVYVPEPDSNLPLDQIWTISVTLLYSGWGTMAHVSHVARSSMLLSIITYTTMQ